MKRELKGKEETDLIAINLIRKGYPQMSKLSWQNDPHGCFADFENERIAEALHAAHLGGECVIGDCDWCEAEQQVDLEAQAENERANLALDFKRQVEQWIDTEEAKERREK